MTSRISNAAIDGMILCASLKLLPTPSHCRQTERFALHGGMVAMCDVQGSRVVVSD